MPRGGKRPGAGRPPSTKNVLPYGATQALVKLRLSEQRLKKHHDAPKNVRADDRIPDEQRIVADRAFQRIVDVMEERVPSSLAPSVLKAATVVRDEVIGPIVQKHEIKGSFSSVVEASLADIEDSRPALPSAGSPTNTDPA